MIRRRFLIAVGLFALGMAIGFTFVGLAEDCQADARICTD